MKTHMTKAEFSEFRSKIEAIKTREARFVDIFRDTEQPQTREMVTTASAKRSLAETIGNALDGDPVMLNILARSDD